MNFAYNKFRSWLIFNALDIYWKYALRDVPIWGEVDVVKKKDYIN